MHLSSVLEAVLSKGSEYFCSKLISHFVNSEKNGYQFWHYAINPIINLGLEWDDNFLGKDLRSKFTES